MSRAVHPVISENLPDPKWLLEWRHLLCSASNLKPYESPKSGINVPSASILKHNHELQRYIPIAVINTLRQDLRIAMKPSIGSGCYSEFEFATFYFHYSRERNNPTYSAITQTLMHWEAILRILSIFEQCYQHSTTVTHPFTHRAQADQYAKYEAVIQNFLRSLNETQNAEYQKRMAAFSTNPYALGEFLFSLSATSVQEFCTQLQANQVVIPSRTPILTAAPSERKAAKITNKAADKSKKRACDTSQEQLPVPKKRENFLSDIHPDELIRGSAMTLFGPRSQTSLNSNTPVLTVETPDGKVIEAQASNMHQEEPQQSLVKDFSDIAATRLSFGLFTTSQSIDAILTSQGITPSPAPTPES